MKKFYEFFQLVVYLMNLDREIDLSSITPLVIPDVILAEDEERHDLIKSYLTRFFVWRHLQINPHFNYYKIEMGLYDQDCDYKGIDFGVATQLMGYYYNKMRTPETHPWGEQVTYEDICNVFVITNKSALDALDITEMGIVNPDTHLKKLTVELCKSTELNSCGLVSHLITPTGGNWVAFDGFAFYNGGPLAYHLLEIMEDDNEAEIVSRLHKIMREILEFTPISLEDLNTLPFYFTEMVICPAIDWVASSDNPSWDKKDCFDDDDMEDWKRILHNFIGDIEKHVADEIIELKEDRAR